MALIKMDYEAVLVQVKKLEKAAADCGDLAAKAGNQITALSEAISGQAADAMIAKLQAWQKDVLKTQTSLESVAARLRSRAESLKAVDENVK